MKIDRRSFLSFAIGGAAGTALTPLPWKLTDDLSIWTQNWPWTPRPPKGESSYTHSVCTLCPGGCGISVRKVDDRAVKIEGLPGHPINDGGICILGLSGLQLLYDPKRIKTPLKRVGKRGEGRWKAISWEAALGQVADRLRALRNDQKPHMLGCIVGRGDHIESKLLRRFLTAFGSPNFMVMPSVWDSLSLALNVMHGQSCRVGYDFEQTDFVLSFGSGWLDGWGSPVRMFRANSRWQEKQIPVVHLDPRLSKTAAKSKRWIPIKPGTEAALALGVAHVLIKEARYHREFVQSHSTGFSGWRSLVLESYAPSKVSAITGVPVERIVKTARAFGAADRPLALCGRGRGDQPIGLNEAMAVHALNALAGNINRPGGVWAIPETETAAWPDVPLDPIAEAGLKTERLDGAGGGDFPYATSLLNRFFTAVGTDDKAPLDMLLVADANPCYEMRDTQGVKQALGKIPFIVSCSPYMNETALLADIILPDHTYLERYQDVSLADGFHRPLLSLAKPVVWPLYDTRSPADVVIELAQRSGATVSQAFPWDGYEACLEKTLADMWDRLQDDVVAVDEAFAPAGWDAAFETASGKFEFGNAKDQLLPVYQPVLPEGDEAEYPLVLVPYDSMRLVSRVVSDPPFVVKTVEDTVLQGKDMFVEINPKTAADLRLKQDGLARLVTPRGEARVRIHLFEGIMPGIVAIPKGLGHQAENPYMKGRGVNVQQLIGPVEDQASGLDSAWGIRAKLMNA